MFTNDLEFPYSGNQGRAIGRFTDNGEIILVTQQQQPDGSTRVWFLHEKDLWQPDAMSVIVPADKTKPRQFSLRYGNVKTDFNDNGSYQDWYRLGIAADKFMTVAGH